MNLLFVPNLEEVPQWKQCYYDYTTLQEIIAFVENSLSFIKTIQNYAQTDDGFKWRRDIQNLKRRTIKIIQTQCMDFLQYSYQECNVISIFVQYKIYQINLKYKRYLQLLKVLTRNSQEIQLLLENLYIETYYLQRTTSYNLAKEEQTIFAINLIIKQLQFTEIDELQPNLKNTRIQKLSSKALEEIEFLYTYHAHQVKHNLEKYKNKQLRQEKIDKILGPLMLGFTMGGLLCFLGIVIVINDINGLGLDESPSFAHDFPAWRGASSILFYSWILSLNLLFYENSQINYKLIFYTENQKIPSSKFMFLFSSTFSFIYLFLFILEFLQISKHLNTKFDKFGEIFWLILLTYIFNPFPIFHNQGRFYLLKTISKILLSPCFPISFVMVWISEQIMSLSQPLTDFFYTICFLSTRDNETCAQLTPNFNSGLVITLCCLRMFQSLKFWRQVTNQKIEKKYDFWAPQFMGFLRASSGLTVSIVGMANRLKLFDSAFTIWLVTIIFSTLLSWYVDVRGDWGLFNHQAKTILRKKLLFPKAKYLYIFIGIFNLFLRVGWVFNISSFVINSTGVWPLLFVMIVSFIQILRRGVWNILRLENEHIQNCGEYQATIKDGHLLKIAEQQSKQIILQQKKRKKRKSNARLQQYIQQQSTKNISIDHIEQFILENNRKTFQFQLFKLKLEQRGSLRSNIYNKFINNQNYFAQIQNHFHKIKFHSKCIPIKSLP